MDVRQLSVVAESWPPITKEPQRRGIEVNINDRRFDDANFANGGRDLGIFGRQLDTIRDAAQELDRADRNPAALFLEAERYWSRGRPTRHGDITLWFPYVRRDFWVV